MFYSVEQENNHIVVKILGLKIKFKYNFNIPKTSTPMEIGSYSGANFISPSAKIGKYCSIGTGVMIGADVHPTTYVTTSPNLYNDAEIEKFPKISIGNDVWIGANAIVFPNRGVYK